MCFSATASFTTSAILVPMGSYAISQAYQYQKRYIYLAAIPLLFGIQQAFEGALWLVLNGQLHIDQQVPALGFLFFAYFLWPFYVPLAALRVEENIQRQRVFLAVATFGFMMGLVLYLPLLLNKEWLSLRVLSGSILYEPKLILGDAISVGTHRIIYAVIVAVPLLFSTVAVVRKFGVLIFFSVIASALLFAYAFVSIWCFFAALLSLYIVYVAHNLSVDLPCPKTA